MLLHTGKEFNCGVYISSVLPSSKAAQAGIKVSTNKPHSVWVAGSNKYNNGNVRERGREGGRERGRETLKL